MIKTESVKKNFIYNALYQLLAILLPLITTPYISRVLGAEGIGIYSYSYSVSKYFVIFAMLGLNNYGNRTIAAVRDDKEKLSRTFWSIYYMQLITACLAIAVYSIYVFAFNSSAVSYIMFLYVLTSLFDINWFFFGIEQFKLTVTRNTLIKLGSVACIFLFVKKSSDVYIYCIILAGCLLLSQLALWPFLKRYVEFVKPCFKEIRFHFKSNIILFIPVLAVSLYKTMDKIMLGNMSSKVEVGFYENSERIIDIPIALIQSLGTVMLPKMSNLMANNKKDEGNRYIRASLVFVVFLASSLSFGIMAVSPEFVPWFYGNGFDACIVLFMILAPSTIFMAIANVVRTQYLIPMHEDKIYIVSVFLGALTNIILNAIFIPVYNAAGAAIGTLCAEAVVCIYQMIKIWKEIDIKGTIFKSIPFIIAGIIMCLMLLSFNLNVQSALLAVLLKVVLGALIYVLIIGMYAVLLKKLNKKLF